MHVRGIRNLALRQDGRAESSSREHAAIIDALCARDGDLAERLVRSHGLGLAALIAEAEDEPAWRTGSDATEAGRDLDLPLRANAAE